MNMEKKLNNEKELNNESIISAPVEQTEQVDTSTAPIQNAEQITTDIEQQNDVAVSADGTVAVVDKRKGKKISVGQIIMYVYLILGAFIIFFPFFVAVSVAISAGGDAPSYMQDGYTVFAHSLDFTNFARIFDKAETGYNVIRGFLNTIMYIVPPVFGGVFCSTMAAYSFARIRFKGKKLVFSALISTMVIPGVITMIPSYVMFSNIYQWQDTPWPLIIPGMLGAPMTMFFIKQFYDGFPKELEEAAFIDGKTRFGVFMDIAFPLAKPVIITQIILSINGAYNDYLGPLLYVGSANDNMTLQVMLALIGGGDKKDYTLVLAGAVVSLIPTFVMFLCAQKFFVEGIVFSGIKG